MEQATKNNNINELSILAMEMGLKVVITEWNVPKQTDISFTMMLGNDATYSFYIAVSPDADAREISEQLYILVGEYNEGSDTIEELKSLDYTGNEIDKIKRTINNLLKNHLSLREKRLGLVD